MHHQLLHTQVIIRHVLLHLFHLPWGRESSISRASKWNSHGETAASANKRVRVNSPQHIHYPQLMPVGLHGHFIHHTHHYHSPYRCSLQLQLCKGPYRSHMFSTGAADKCACVSFPSSLFSFFFLVSTLRTLLILSTLLIPPNDLKFLTHSSF